MLTFLKNAVSGKNAHFFNVFTAPKQTILDGFTRLPAPRDRTQLALLRTLKDYIDASVGFAHAIFYGFNGNAPILPESELRSMTPDNGNRAISLILVSLIRYSLVQERVVSDFLVAIASALIPPEHAAEAERAAFALGIPDLKSPESVLSVILERVFPMFSNNGAARLRALVLFHVCSSGLTSLTRETLNALPEGAGNG